MQVLDCSLSLDHGNIGRVGYRHREREVFVVGVWANVLWDVLHMCIRSSIYFLLVSLEVTSS